ncbi:MAG: translation elongation factor Ts [Oscillospiraceae bacterium]|jgi:elongation factor Ts|nr:translation elongation factor Ts [Oscillospiraceae bacterium]
MNITAQDVKALREKTGCGMMDCKKALVEANGDAQTAIDILRKKGLDASAKKSGRVASEGVAMAITNDDNTVGVCIEVNSETDFVAKNSKFLEFVKICAETVMHSNPLNLEELLATKAYREDKKIDDLLKENILVIGENIKIRRFERFEGAVSTYVHASGRMASLVVFNVSSEFISNDEFKTFSNDIAMHVVAANPLYIDRHSISQSIIDHEKKIFSEQIAKEGKPESIAQKIAEGRMGKFYEENCLLEQPFVKDTKISVGSYIKSVSENLATNLSVKSFVRYEKGGQ